MVIGGRHGSIDRRHSVPSNHPLMPLSKPTHTPSAKTELDAAIAALPPPPASSAPMPGAGGLMGGGAGGMPAMSGMPGLPGMGGDMAQMMGMMQQMQNNPVGAVMCAVVHACTWL